MKLRSIIAGPERNGFGIASLLSNAKNLEKAFYSFKEDNDGRKAIRG